MTTQTVINPRVLRPRQAAEYIGISIASFWRIAKSDPDFPTPFKLSANSSAIMREDLDAWLKAKQEAAQ